MSISSYIAEFKCEDCNAKYGVLNEKAAVSCKTCHQYFLDWTCHKTHTYAKDGWKTCRACSEKPKVCNVCSINPVKFGTCRECYIKTLPKGLCLLD